MKTDPRGTRRLVIASAGTAAGLVLLFSHSTDSVTPATVSSAALPGGTTDTTGTDTTGTDTTVTAPAASASPSASAPATTTTYAGSVAQTRWGPVQVQVTVTNGKVVSATVLQVPDGNRRDQEINAYAVPVLNQEAVRAGTAQIDSVSGATVTSNGYITSLQAALDSAGIP